MGQIGDKKTSKNIQNFYCENCDFKCSKKGDWERHIIRPKHINLTNLGHFVTEKHQKNIFACDVCEKEYFSRNGLWAHKKKCKPNLNNNNFNFVTPELVMELIKDNKELKQIIFEQNSTINNLVKNGTTNTNTNYNNSNNNINNHSNNKTFNLQFFLNDTCKNAMNIMDFVESIKLQLKDLEKFGEHGYVEGISSIITNYLKAMDESLRPVHCTDRKREVVYIKDEDKWEKDDDNKTKLRKVIKKVANKNIRLLPLFKEEHPDYNDSDSKYSDQYSKIVIESMGGNDGNEIEKENKIIHNISKCVIIDKYSE